MTFGIYPNINVKGKEYKVVGVVKTIKDANKIVGYYTNAMKRKKGIFYYVYIPIRSEKKMTKGTRYYGYMVSELTGEIENLEGVYEYKPGHESTGFAYAKWFTKRADRDKSRSLYTLAIKDYRKQHEGSKSQIPTVKLKKGWDVSDFIKSGLESRRK